QTLSFSFLTIRHPPKPTLFPYTTLFRSQMATVARAESPLYLQIAESMTQQVARGALRPGDRVPSLRRLSRQRRVSMSTALQAYRSESTRLNSSHRTISYAVFCLKKKKKQ